VVGKVTTENANCELPGADGGSAPGIEDKVIEIGWSTSFENGLCDYQRARGFCYDPGEASIAIVDDPVRDGNSAAAFSVTSAAPVDGGENGTQARCFLEGALPREAVYGAWFYIPELRQSTDNWNLMYIPGKDAGPALLSGLWDVSLRNTPDNSLELYIYGHISAVPERDPLPLVPIGSWFHVEFRLLRAEDATGEVELRQDGVTIQSATGIVTDQYDYHQWYVGNLAEGLTPPESTIYVDEVTISAP
jgi:hypothetical protein